METIANAVPANPKLDPMELHAILEIALLCIASDRSINPDEAAAFKRIGAKLGFTHLDALLDTVDPNATRADADDRLLALAAKLKTTEAKELAYRAAYALALSDLASTDEEFEFDLQLVDALGLEQSVVNRIGAEVLEAIQPPET